MTTHEAMFLLWKTLVYFQPDCILEIGFGAGQTMALILEATESAKNIVSVDKGCRYQNSFNQLFPDNEICFLQQDSKNLNLTNKFDFIIIDGDHDYQMVRNDVEKCLPLLHQDSILCMDDYLFFDGVSKTVKEYLLGQHGFVPFLSGLQNMFFHHQNHDVNMFLDSYIMTDTDDFIQFNQIDYHGYGVLQGTIVSKAFRDDSALFSKILEFYGH